MSWRRLWLNRKQLAGVLYWQEEHGERLWGHQHLGRGLWNGPQVHVTAFRKLEGACHCLVWGAMEPIAPSRGVSSWGTPSMHSPLELQQSASQVKLGRLVFIVRQDVDTGFSWSWAGLVGYWKFPETTLRTPGHSICQTGLGPSSANS